MIEFLLGVAFTVTWDYYQASSMKKELKLTVEELRNYISGLTQEEAEYFTQEIGMDVYDHVLEHVEDHHNEVDLENWEYEDLLDAVDGSEWEDLVGGDLGDDIKHWYGTHIPDVSMWDASREDLIEFHKYAYLRRLMLSID